MRPYRRAPLLLALGVVLAGCGARPSTGSPAGSASSSAFLPGQSGSGWATGASGTTGAGLRATLTASADSGHDTLDLTATVTGPARLQGGCQPTLVATLADASGATVPPPTPSPGVRCLAITEETLAPGETREYTASLPLPRAHGAYTVHARLSGGGDLPVLSVDL